MTYETTYYLLDKDNKIETDFLDVPCFLAIIFNNNFTDKTKYLVYDFSNMKVTQTQARRYFLFLKAIPEFKELMPKSCTAMAQAMQYKIDLHKFNGTKIFTMLTLIRAVVEDPDIVKEVLSFKPKFNYSISKFSILKLCGAVLHKNSGHWITMKVHPDNITKMFNTRDYWDDPTPCIQTGLGRNIFNTFKMPNEGYGLRQYVTQKDINAIKGEHKA